MLMLLISEEKMDRHAKCIFKEQSVVFQLRKPPPFAPTYPSKGGGFLIRDFGLQILAKNNVF